MDKTKSEFGIQKSEIIYRDPVELKPHPLYRSVPPPNKDTAAWKAMVDSVEAAGVMQPLLITSNGLIMDGGWRWLAAKQNSLESVPCVVRPETEAATIIADTLIHRKLMTRGAAIYLLLPLLREYIAGAENRRLANLRRGTQIRQKALILPKSSTLEFGSQFESQEALCEHWGISTTTFYDAKHVFALLRDPKCTALVKLIKEASAPMPGEVAVLQQELREEFEPQLFSGEKNLWNVASAIGGRLATADQPRKDNQLEFWDQSFQTLVHGARQWEEFPKAKRNAFIESWRATVEALPEEVRHEMAEVLNQIEKEAA